MISGRAAGGASATSKPPSSSASAARKALRGIGVEGEQRLTGGHRLPGTAMDPDAGAGLHLFARTGSARTEPPSRQPHRHRVDVAHCAAPVGGDGFGVPTNRQRHRQVPALRGDQRPEPVHRRAVAQRLRRDRGGRCRRARASRGPGATVSSTTSGGPPPASTSSASATSSALPTVAPSGQFMSVSSARVGSPCAAPSATMVWARSRHRDSERDQRAGTDLHVEHQRAGPLGDLLAHHRAGDQRQRFDRGGDVAQRVELRVGRRQLPGREDRRADIAKLLAHLLVGQDPR